VSHGALHIPLRDSQGTLIFLFFIWVTSSQAILTLIRLRAVASWKVSAAMLLILLFVVFIYLFAVESFTAFLYPNPEEVASYFQAAAFPNWLFDGLIVGTALVIILGWFYIYAQARGRKMWVPYWVEGLRLRLYVLFMNRLYVDELYQALGRVVIRVVHRIDKRDSGWSK
jgi:NADH-quinone oxidoreductase subunit L